MTDLPASARCRNCQRVVEAETLDGAGWCEACRQVVVHRATLAGWIAGALGAVGLAAWIFTSVRPGPRFLIVWLVLLAAVYFVLYKLTRRVAFEMIRARGVPAPEE